MKPSLSTSGVYLLGFLFILSCTALPLVAASLVVLEEKHQQFPLGLHLELLEDKNGRWTFSEITASDFSAASNSF